MRERKLSGLPHGRPPFGYRRCDDGCRGKDENHPYWHIVPEEASLVQEAFHLYAGRHLSMSRIAEVLDSRRPGSENRFTHGVVSDILHNYHYVGLLHVETNGEDEFVPGVQLPIVDKSVFDDVQKRLDSNAMDFNRRGRRSKIGHVLSRLVRCYDCGAKFNVTVQGSQSEESYYRMHKRATGTACHFAGRSFSGRDVNAQVDQLFSCFRLREGWHQTVIDKYISNADVDIIQAQRDKIEDRIKRLDARFDVGTLTEADFRKEVVRLKEELNRLQLPETDDITKAGELLEDFGQIWRGSTRHEQNELLQLILDAVYIDPDNRRIVSIQPKGPFASLIREMVERSDIRLEEDYQPPFSRNFSEHGTFLLWPAMFLGILAICGFVVWGAVETGRIFFLLYMLPVPLVGGYICLQAAGLTLKGTGHSELAMVASKADYLGLWDLAEQCADIVGSVPPDNILVGMSANFYVTENAVSLVGQWRSPVVDGRTLYVSAPLLRLMNRAETSAVLAHEICSLHRTRHSL